jgi:hypothetical protein
VADWPVSATPLLSATGPADGATKVWPVLQAPKLCARGACQVKSLALAPLPLSWSE